MLVIGKLFPDIDLGGKCTVTLWPLVPVSICFVGREDQLGYARTSIPKEYSSRVIATHHLHCATTFPPYMAHSLPFFVHWQKQLSTKHCARWGMRLYRSGRAARDAEAVLVGAVLGLDLARLSSSD